MSNAHLTPPAAQQVIAEARLPLREELINGRHAPHAPSEKAVMAIMKHTGQAEFDPNYTWKITEDVAELPEVRQPLEEFHSHLFQDVDHAPPFNPTESAIVAWEKHGDFLRNTLSHERLMDNTRRNLAKTLVYASRHHGFPLNPDQIYARLRSVRLGYTHPHNDFGAAGHYFGHVNSGFVSLTPSYSLKEADTICHELFHALSAQRYVDRQTVVWGKDYPLDVAKVGLSSNYSGRWANEAMTEMLTQIAGDPRNRLVQFDHPTATVEQIANGVIPEILGLNDTTQPEEDRHAYTDEKVAFLHAFADIPFSLLINAYFVQDKDDPAGTQYLGAAAEKELWREVKRRGGPARIKQLRTIEAAFESGQPGQARALALEMKKTYKSRRAALKRGVYGRQVARNTQRVQQGVEQARAILRDQVS